MTGTFGLVREIGVRHLGARRLRSVLTIAGIAAGVALLFSIGTMNAELVGAVRSTATAFDVGADLQVTAATPGGLAPVLAADLDTVPGVGAAAPVLQVRTRFVTGDQAQGAFVLGVTPLLAEVLAPDGGDDEGLRIDGDPLAPGSVVLSSQLASRLGVAVGDVVEIVTPTGRRPLPVSAVATSPLLDRFNGGMVATLPLAEAQALFDRPGRVDLILLDADPAATAAVTERVGGVGLVTDPAEVANASNENVNPFLLLTDSVGLISLFVALVLVFNTMSMAMAERRRELSLARALGATPRQLFGSVLVEAAVLGLAGTVIGLVVGGVLARVLLGPVSSAYESVLPVDAPGAVSLRAGPLLIAAGGGIAVAVLGAVLPARRAMRAAPIDSLRPVAPYEWIGDAGRSRAVLAASSGAALLVTGLALAATQTEGIPTTTSSALFVLAILGGLLLLPQPRCPSQPAPWRGRSSGDGEPSAASPATP